MIDVCAQSGHELLSELSLSGSPSKQQRRHLLFSLWLEDRYRVLALLGQGGFGRTFEAVDEYQAHKPPCVIKQFACRNSDPQAQQIALKLFYEEAQHLQSLGNHPQIPTLLACFDVEGQPYRPKAGQRTS